MSRPDWVDRRAITMFVIGCFGVAALLYGAGSSFNTVSFLGDAQMVEGTVEELEQRKEWSRRRRVTVTYFQVGFVAGDSGRTVIEVENDRGVPDSSVGDSIDLLYLEEAPEDARVDSFLGVWGGAVFGFAAAVMCLSVSA